MNEGQRIAFRDLHHDAVGKGEADDGRFQPWQGFQPFGQLCGLEIEEAGLGREHQAIQDFIGLDMLQADNGDVLGPYPEPRRIDECIIAVSQGGTEQDNGHQREHKSKGRPEPIPDHLAPLGLVRPIAIALFSHRSTILISRSKRMP